MLRVNLERGSKLYQVFEGSPLKRSLPVKDDPDLKGGRQVGSDQVHLVYSLYGKDSEAAKLPRRTCHNLAEEGLPKDTREKMREYNWRCIKETTTFRATEHVLLRLCIPWIPQQYHLSYACSGFVFQAASDIYSWANIPPHSFQSCSMLIRHI